MFSCLHLEFTSNYCPIGVNNAIKFTESGHVLISAECLSQTEETTTLRISVDDTGIGIEEEAIQHIFDRFTQADASTTRRYGGTGLGLAICRQLVALMNGTIEAESSPGRGSRFFFEITLPIGEAKPITAQAVSKADLTGVRVLIVDDNAVNRQVLEEQLMQWKLRCNSVISGPDALSAMHKAHASGDPYAIVLLDYQMPVMDGMDLAKAIKAEPNFSKSHLIMLTSIGLYDNLKSERGKFLSAYLVKPVRQSVLLNTLIQVWSENRSPTTSPARRKRASRSWKRNAEKRLFPKVRILLAEDNRVNQKVAVHMLEELGCQVNVASNGQEAVRLLELCPFDLVFMDCRMPELDGYEATKLIRARSDAVAKLPIIAMTASAMAGDRERCLAIGMDDYISKPVTKSDLADALQQWAPQTEVATATEVNEDSIDITVLKRLNTGSIETFLILVSQIAQAFRDEFVEGIEGLGHALEKRDRDEATLLAHSLKGSASDIGAPQLFKLCQSLETLADADNFSSAKQLIDPVTQEFSKARRCLDQHLQSFQTSTSE